MGDHRIFFWLESYNSAAKYVADLHVWGWGGCCVVIWASGMRCEWWQMCIPSTETCSLSSYNGQQFVRGSHVEEKSIYVIYGILNIILCKENIGHKAKYLYISVYNFPKMSCSCNYFVHVCVSKMFLIIPW